jgi:hypothetical protein
MAADSDNAGAASGDDWSPWVYVDLDWGTPPRRSNARPVQLTIHFGEHALDVPGAGLEIGGNRGLGNSWEIGV